MAKRAVVQYNMQVKWVRQAFSISETCYRYEAKLNTENDEITDWLSRLTKNKSHVTAALSTAGRYSMYHHARHIAVS
jgi:hypothetical protein